MTTPTDDTLREEIISRLRAYKHAETNDVEVLTATIERPEMVTIDEADKLMNLVADSLLALYKSHQARIEREAVDKKLQTLQEVVPLLELCENDADRILIWAKNHRWSLIAPPGKNTTDRSALTAQEEKED